MPSDQPPRSEGDELDLILRGAMKALDDQVPARYFDGLAKQTLARLSSTPLEDGTMPTTPAETETQTDRVERIAVPPIDMSALSVVSVVDTGKPTDSGRVHAETENAVPEREEDSGLHDIRSLAQSTKQRLSSKVTAIPEEDVLAASSAGWKNVALPEPARMVSLPDLSELPSKEEIKAKTKGDKKLAAAAVAPEMLDPDVATATAATSIAPGSPAPRVAQAATARPMIGARIAANSNTGGRGKAFALVGIGLVAAAGVAFYVITNKEAKDEPAVVAMGTTAKDVKPEPAAIVPPPVVEQKAEEPVVADTAAAGSAAPVESAPEPAKAATKSDAKAKVSKKPEKAVEIDLSVTPKDKKPIEKPPVVGKGEGKGKEGDPNFDDLLKEAGVKDKQIEKPKLEKKSLSGDDIKRGMSAVAGKAQACFAGTQGSAAVKLTVNPDGKVAKVGVTGPFANTPVGECVANAVRSTSFPAWEGGPQTISYSYLLEEK